MYLIIILLSLLILRGDIKVKSSHFFILASICLSSIFLDTLITINRLKTYEFVSSIIDIFRVTSSQLMILTTVILSFLPGCFFLLCLGFKHKFTMLEWIPLSNVFSILLFSLIYMLSITLNIRPELVMSLTLIPITLIASLKILYHRRIFDGHQKGYLKISNLLLLTTISLSILMSIDIHLGALFTGYYDSIRHVSTAYLFLYNINYDNLKLMSFDRYPYPGFYMSSAMMLYIISKALDYVNRFSFNFALNLIPPLTVPISFYIFILAYSRKNRLDQRVPIISTILFTLFSGLGWLCYIESLLTERLMDFSNILQMCYWRSLFDIGHSHGFWLYGDGRPMAWGFSGLFLILYLFQRDDLRRSKILFIALVTLMISLLHPPELFFLIFCMIILYVMNMRCNEIPRLSAGLAIGVSLSILAKFLIENEIGCIYDVPLHYLVSVLVASGIPLFGVLMFKVLKVKMKLLVLKQSSYKILRGISIVISALYLIGILYWVLGRCVPERELYWYFNLYPVPWYMYTIKLGVIGFASFLFPLFAYHFKNLKKLTEVFVLLIASIIFGRILTLINSYIVLRYWELRIIPMVYAFACILTASVFISVLDKLALKNVFRKIIIISSLLCLLFISSFSSTILTWDLQALSNVPTLSELQDIEYFYTKLNKPISTIITFSGKSHQSYSVFIPREFYHWRILPRSIAREDNVSPELVLNFLTNFRYPVLVYYNSKLDEISTRANYLANHLIYVLPRTCLSDHSQLLFVPNMSAPLHESDVALIVPLNDMADLNNTWLAYDLLSFNRINYTTAHEGDFAVLRKVRTLIISPGVNLSYIMRYVEVSKPSNLRKIVFLSNPPDRYVERLREIGLKVYQFNLTDVVKRMERGDCKNVPLRTFRTDLPKIFGDASRYTFSPYRFFSPDSKVILTRRIFGNGWIIINSTSLVLNSSGRSIIVKLKNGTTLSPSRIYLMPGNGYLTAYLKSFALSDGYGFYSKLTVKNISLYSKESDEFIIWNMGNVTPINNALEVSCSNCTLITRTPIIKVLGDLTLQKTFVFGHYICRWCGGGLSFKIKGLSTFKVEFSGSWLMLREFKFSGEPIPEYRYCEIPFLMG